MKSIHIKTDADFKMKSKTLQHDPNIIKRSSAKMNGWEQSVIAETNVFICIKIICGFA